MKNAKINKKYMAIALRFLRETGLLPFWKEYVIKETNKRGRFRKIHWSMNGEIYIDQIFGLTNFTGFVIRKIEKKRNQLKNNGEYEIAYYLPSVYLLFGAWLRANSSLYGEYTLEGEALKLDATSHIIVDTKRRKTTILLDEYFVGHNSPPNRRVALGQVLKEINKLC